VLGEVGSGVWAGCLWAGLAGGTGAEAVDN
jgi:hypothetical protein